MNLNLTQMEYIKAVAELSSFSKAAQVCGVSQPTLSNAVAQFESEAGAPVFKRTTRTVALTSFGEHILSHIKEILDSKEDLSTAIDLFMNPEHKILKIGVSTLIKFQLVKTMIDPYMRSNPHIDFVFKECGREDLLTRLESENLDFIFTLRTEQKQMYRKIPFYKESLYYIPREVEPNGSQSQNGSICVKELGGDTFVMGPEVCGLADATRNVFRNNGVELQEYRGKAQTYGIIEEWAELGIGSAILPKGKLTMLHDRAKELHDNSDEPVRLVYEVVWNKYTERHKHIKDFVFYLNKAVPKLLESMEV